MELLVLTHNYYLIVSVGQEWRHGLAGPSTSGSLTWCQFSGVSYKRLRNEGFASKLCACWQDSVPYGLLGWGAQLLTCCRLEGNLSSFPSRPLEHGCLFPQNMPAKKAAEVKVLCNRTADGTPLCSVALNKVLPILKGEEITPGCKYQEPGVTVSHVRMCLTKYAIYFNTIFSHEVA